MIAELGGHFAITVAEATAAHYAIWHELTFTFDNARLMSCKFKGQAPPAPN